MSLDPTATRANETGWSPDALRAEREAKREAKRQADRAKRAAAWSGFWGAIWTAISWTARAIWTAIAETWDFMVRNLVLTAAIAASITTALWEWTNTAAGWRDLYPNYGIWTSVGAAGSVSLWYLSFRKAREEGRKDAKKPKADGGLDKVELVGWIMAGVFAFIVCVAGVFVATATNYYKAQLAAKQSKTAFVELQAKRDALAATLEVYSVDYYDAVLKQQNRMLESQVQIAKGTFDMADLDVDKGCSGKLSFNQRRLCARVNGGVDEATGEQIVGLRTEIEQSERARKAAVENTAELERLRDEVANFNVLDGDETADAIGSMAKGVDSASMMGVLYIVLSGIFLLASGWAADWALEQIEAKRVAARARKGKA